MKKIFIAFLLAFSGFVSFAQDYGKLTLFMTQKKPDDAKKELDKLLADPKAKDKAETYFWQLDIYANFYYDSAYYAKYPNADSIAWVALETYTAKDTGLVVLKQNKGLYPALEYLKDAAINVGIISFNHNNWEKSLGGFLQVDRVDEYMVAHNLEPKNYLDTNIVLYSGYAAQNSSKPDVAVKYYDILADQGLRIGDTKKFETNMYTFIVDHYLKNGDTQNFNKYLAVAKKVFPEYNNEWQQMEMQNATTNSSLKDLLAKYKADATTGKLTEDQYAQYGDAFSQPDKKQVAQLDSANKVQLKLSAADAYGAAFRLNNNPIYAYNIGVIYYNVYDEELGNRYFALRGEGAALKTQRDAVEKEQQRYSDSSASWLTQAYTLLKPKTDNDKRMKSILTNAIKDLANIYQWKEEKAKGIDPKAVDKYDALYKQYDAEADTIK